MYHSLPRVIVNVISAPIVTPVFGVIDIVGSMTGVCVSVTGADLKSNRKMKAKLNTGLK